ncbi:MAG: hypothetical protein RJA04_485, partial [Bacteroidota bacterium]
MKYITLGLIWLFSLTSFAQSTQISGLVQTASHEALPGASIILVGTVRGVQSNNAGQYILKGLKPGKYTIKVSFVGLQSAEKEINLKEGESNISNFTLNDATELSGVSVFAQSGVKGNGFLPQVNEYTITAGKKNEVIVLDNLQANLAMNNSRQIFSRTPGISVWESDGSGIQLGVASRGLSPNRSWEFNVRMDGYDITPDPMGYP